eukprot:CAMPEP_0194772942 /NCGR_PEP_ID=MMETSP0323_2-20130528/53407_1 /TAXON_ID=2866 ORGANISM="Crypthecodinium cohnii, Strain Seligo" /NCGR_SAMPLE_ID=MMETSP0323_2 /ASSEMBLY_ACC=CAM_ASM_000346 /LENGTH=138 /DNA_ID=CAMNT_0039707707 /DNA_START=26 /DNA_END=439 /DNA_ORIENTATION=+
MACGPHQVVRWTGELPEIGENQHCKGLRAFSGVPGKATLEFRENLAEGLRSKAGRKLVLSFRGPEAVVPVMSAELHLCGPFGLIAEAKYLLLDRLLHLLQMLLRPQVSCTDHRPLRVGHFHPGVGSRRQLEARHLPIW